MICRQTAPGTVGTVQLYAGAKPLAEIDGERFRLDHIWGGTNKDCRARAINYAPLSKLGGSVLVAIGHGQYTYLYCGVRKIAVRAY